MSTPTPRPALYIKKVRGMGRGVFAGRPFRAGEVIEVCSIIPLPARVDTACPVLIPYVFEWGPDGDDRALALGYGSLYNHSSDPNAAFTPRLSRSDIVFRAVRAIVADEQIFIDYRWGEENYTAFLQSKPAKNDPVCS